jgi:glycosyltransferase involved in cell wall biosynthesis
MVITEAMHAGLPVIASRQSAISEALAKHAEAALQFEDAAQLRLHLLCFATRPELRIGLRQAATSPNSSLPTWGGAEARFYDLLLQRLSALACTRAASCWSEEPWRISSAAGHGSAKRTVARTSR